MTDLDHLRVVLVATRNPLNIGAAARAMSNFGVRRLRVVNPYDAAFREARSAVGASGLLAKAEQYENVAEAVADCKLVVGTTAATRRELQHRLLRLDVGARDDQAAAENGAGSIAVRLRAIRAIESGNEPLPLVDADPHARRTWFDESRPGGGSLPLRTGARPEDSAGKNELLSGKKTSPPPPREKWSA